MENGEAKRPFGKRVTYWTITVVGISAVLLIVAIIALTAICAQSSSQTIDLNASVTLQGTQFLITNKNDFDWTNIKMEVNRGLATPGFAYNANKITAGKTFTVPCSKFLKLDGTPFNPSTIKIQKFSIACDTPEGEGSWNATWR